MCRADGFVDVDESVVFRDACNRGLQFDPRGFIYISDPASGMYVVQYEDDGNPDHVFPNLHW